MGAERLRLRLRLGGVTGQGCGAYAKGGLKG